MLRRSFGRASHVRLCTPVNPDAWREGANTLLRPQDVRGLWQMVHVNWHRRWFPVPLGEAVAVAMQVLLSNGHLRYERDPEDCDLWREPRETLALGYGDCEDLAGVAGSALAMFGNEPWLVVGTWNGEGHAWIEGHDERGWFLIEATSGKIHRYARPTEYRLLSAFNRTQRAA